MAFLTRATGATELTRLGLTGLVDSGAPPRAVGASGTSDHHVTLRWAVHPWGGAAGGHGLGATGTFDTFGTGYTRLTWGGSGTLEAYRCLTGLG